MSRTSSSRSRGRRARGDGRLARRHEPVAATTPACTRATGHGPLYPARGLRYGRENLPTPRLMPRRPPKPLLDRLVNAVVSSPTDEHVHDLAAALAPVIARKRSPGVSLGAYERRIRARGASDEACEALVAAVTRLLAPTSTVAPGSERGEIGLPEASRAVGVAERTLRDQLKRPAYRRLYGWPVWRGHGWRFVPAAVDPTTSRTFLATLPEREPAPIAALLPPWCEPDDAAVPPRVGAAEEPT